MTTDDLHRTLLSWQPAWFRALPLPIRELPAVLMLVPLLWFLPPWVALSGYALGSHLYEVAFSFKAEDALWRLYWAMGLTIAWSTLVP